MVSLVPTGSYITSSAAQSGGKLAVGVPEGGVHSSISAGKIDLGSGNSGKPGEQFLEIVSTGREASHAGEDSGMCPTSIEGGDSAGRGSDKTANFGVGIERSQVW